MVLPEAFTPWRVTEMCEMQQAPVHHFMTPIDQEDGVKIRVLASCDDTIKRGDFCNELK